MKYQVLFVKICSEKIKLFSMFVYLLSFVCLTEDVTLSVWLGNNQWPCLISMLSTHHISLSSEFPESYFRFKGFYALYFDICPSLVWGGQFLSLCPAVKRSLSSVWLLLLHGWQRAGTSYCNCSLSAQM